MIVHHQRRGRYIQCVHKNASLAINGMACRQNLRVAELHPSFDSWVYAHSPLGNCFANICHLQEKKKTCREKDESNVFHFCHTDVGGLDLFLCVLYCLMSVKWRNNETCRSRAEFQSFQYGRLWKAKGINGFKKQVDCKKFVHLLILFPFLPLPFFFIVNWTNSCLAVTSQQFFPN